MKLDFEIQPTGAFLSGALTETIDSPNASEKLPAGISAAREGNRAEARVLLLQAIESEPHNEDAWLWLASISEYPEELLGFLNNVLNINPKNERALDWAKATKSMLSKTFLQRGIDASRENQNNFARQCFLQSIVNDDENETAWLWLASASAEIKEKNACLEKVLLLNPENETALDSIKTVKRQMAEERLPEALVCAFGGETATALEMIEQILASAPDNDEALLLKSYLVESFDEKIACFEKVLRSNPANETARVNAEFLSSAKARYSDQATGENPDELEQFFDVSIVEDEGAPAEFDERGDENFDDAENGDLSAGNDYLKAESAEEKVSVESEQEDAASDFSGETADDFQDANRSVAALEENFAADGFQAEDFENVASSSLTEPQNEEVVSEEFDGETDFAPKQSEFESSFDEDEEVFEMSENEPPPSDFAAADKFADIYDEFTATGEDEEFEEFDDNNSAVEDAALPLYYETEKPDADGENVSRYAQPSEGSAPETTNQKIESTDEDSFTPVDNADFETPGEKSTRATVACPFCGEENETQALDCDSCRAVLSLSDLETLLAGRECGEAVRRAVEELEETKNLRELDADELRILGIGRININDFSSGLTHLRQAARMNRNDVVLISQVNALAIRLAETEEQAGAADAAPKNKTILIVDDSATVRKLIAGKLEKSGHAVVCAADGMDALEKIKHITPDLILLDIVMPQMDGYQVCKLIRADAKTRDVPVVMISGKDGFFDKVRGRMAGTTGYITKPFGPETLMKTIESYIVGDDSIE